MTFKDIFQVLCGLSVLGGVSYATLWALAHFQVYMGLVNPVWGYVFPAIGLFVGFFCFTALALKMGWIKPIEEE